MKRLIDILKEATKTQTLPPGFASAIPKRTPGPSTPRSLHQRRQDRANRLRGRLAGPPSTPGQMDPEKAVGVWDPSHPEHGEWSPPERPPRKSSGPGFTAMGVPSSDDPRWDTPSFTLSKPATYPTRKGTAAGDAPGRRPRQEFTPQDVEKFRKMGSSPSMAQRMWQKLKGR